MEKMKKKTEIISMLDSLNTDQIEYIFHLIKLLIGKPVN